MYQLINQHLCMFIDHSIIQSLDILLFINQGINRFMLLLPHTVPVDIRDYLISGGARHGQPTRAFGVSLIVYLLCGQSIEIGLERKGGERMSERERVRERK